jgi:hypothetical protein
MKNLEYKYLTCTVCNEKAICLSTWFECPEHSMCSNCYQSFLTARIEQEKAKDGKD